jgi:hypothetical protein
MLRRVGWIVVALVACAGGCGKDATAVAAPADAAPVDAAPVDAAPVDAAPVDARPGILGMVQVPSHSVFAEEPSRRRAAANEDDRAEPPPDLGAGMRWGEAYRGDGTRRDDERVGVGHIYDPRRYPSSADRPRVYLERVDVASGRDQAEAVAALQKVLPALDACRSSASGDGANVDFDFLIDSRGRPNVVDVDTAPAGWQSCAAAALTRVRFAPREGAGTVQVKGQAKVFPKER